MIAFMTKLISLVGITGEGEIEFLSAKFSGTTWSVVVESYLTAKTQNRGMFVIRYMQPLVSKVPVMVVEGDHEIEQQAGNQTFAVTVPDLHSHQKRVDHHLRYSILSMQGGYTL